MGNLKNPRFRGANSPIPCGGYEVRGRFGKVWGKSSAKNALSQPVKERRARRLMDLSRGEFRAPGRVVRTRELSGSGI